MDAIVATVKQYPNNGPLAQDAYEVLILEKYYLIRQT